MKHCILCTMNFNSSYINLIQQQIPSTWKVRIAKESIEAVSQSPSILCVLGGSATQQKEQTLKVRFSGGSSTGTLTVPLLELHAFLEKF